MGTFTAKTSSNYFRVKNNEAFEAWCESLGVEYRHQIHRPEAGSGTFYAISAITEEGTWPVATLDLDTGEVDEVFSFLDALAAHLDPRDVVILLEAGNEKSFVSAEAVAVHADKPNISINLADILDKAREAYGADAVITAPDGY